MSVVRILTVQTSTRGKIKDTENVLRYKDAIGADKQPDKNNFLKTVDCSVIHTLACTATESGQCMGRSDTDLHWN